MVGTHLITYNTYHISTNWAFSLSSFICGGQVSDFGVYCLQKLFLGSDMSSFYISLCGFRVLCLCLKWTYLRSLVNEVTWLTRLGHNVRWILIVQAMFIVWNIVKPCPTGKCLATKLDQTLFLVTKHVDVVPVSNMSEHGRCPNEQHVLQCVIHCLSAFRFYYTRSNKVMSKRKNVWSSLVAKHFSFGLGF